ncbi:MAG: glyoxylate-induced protein [Anaerocolumna sp.]|jgi:hydroxypyruvate isomerase|nr:glyoxylate-induced protein [Anaerocolumna sp.]
MELDICIDMVYSGRDFIESLESIKQLGITSYEFWQWWDKDIDAIRMKQNELNMNCTTFCTKFITLLDPLKRSEYINGLCESIEIAKKLNTKLLISQVGNQIQDKVFEEQWGSLVDGLKACVPHLEKNHITLLIEPLNLFDHPGYFLTNSKDAFRLIDEVGSEYVKILYDIYHYQNIEGNLIKTITENISKIGHFHCAGNPGRGNIINGEINYHEVFKAIQGTNYDGNIGLECNIKDNIDVGIKAASALFSESK